MKAGGASWQGAGGATAAGHPVSLSWSLTDGMKLPIRPSRVLLWVKGRPHRCVLLVRFLQVLFDQLFNSSEKRLARTLLLLANFGKEGRPEPIIAKISQETLAEMIGTTRSRVSFFMNRFRKLGLIDYNGQIEVHSSLLNVVLREKPEINER